MFVWPVEALDEALLLLLARHVQKKLENDRPLPSEIILEVRNVEESLIPDAFAHERWRQLLSLQNMLMHAHHEDLFVVRSVENPDSSPLGQALDVTPEKVMIEVLPRWLLERENLAALWIYS